METFPPTLHISRTIRIPPLTAQAEIDELLAWHLRNGGPHRRRSVVGTPRAQLVVGGNGAVARTHPLAQYRRWFGSLVGARRRLGIPVELELGPWSSTSCELGLRPMHWIGPSGQPAYFDMGVDVMDHLATALDAAALAGLEQRFHQGGVRAAGAATSLR